MSILCIIEYKYRTYLYVSVIMCMINLVFDMKSLGLLPVAGFQLEHCT